MADDTPAVLIVGYQRPQNIIEIVQTCILEGIKNFYISVDYPKNEEHYSLANYSKILAIKDNFKDSSLTFHVNTYSVNLGCATHVVSACDWVFEFETNVVILEDDCLPSVFFFRYCNYYFQIEKLHENLVLASGSQFAPNLVKSDGAVFSKYPLIWGWASTQSNWEKIRIGICNSRIERWSLSEFDEEQIYWKEGSRRARMGFVDAWDTPLAEFISSTDYFTLAPRNNLVSNVGDDDWATHTSGDIAWLRKDTGRFIATDQRDLAFDLGNERFLRRDFYRIRKRHLISTRITRLRDLFNRKKRTLLLDSVNNAKFYQLK
jgi:hypothetical protein